MPEVEFGSRDAANAFREANEQHLCSKDDRRKKTVTLAPDAPDRVVDEAAIKAASSREDRSGNGGQAPLADHERDRIDFSEGRASVPHARSVKGLMLSEGVSDWLSHYDPTLTVDEHREVAERAATEGGGERLDAEATTDERLADVEAALDGQCDHAADHCEHGDPDACEFLTEECGLDEDDVDAILSDDDPDAEQEITGEAAGALGRAWQGYKAGISRFERELRDTLEAKSNAEQAAAAINAIRADHGQEPIEFERLEELSDRFEYHGEEAHEADGHIEERP